jgi:hypothetical protein
MVINDHPGKQHSGAQAQTQFVGQSCIQLPQAIAQFFTQLLLHSSGYGAQSFPHSVWQSQAQLHVEQAQLQAQA